MSRQRFRANQGGIQERLHQKLRFFFPLGDEIEEPFALGGYFLSNPAGTVVGGPYGGKAREFSTSLLVPLLYAAANSSITMVNKPWTAMFFINFNSSGNVQLFYGHSSGTWIVVSTSNIQYLSNGTVVASAAVSLNINTWYHVAISVGTTSGSWKMYLNGSPLSLSQNGNSFNFGYSGSAAAAITIYLIGNVAATFRLDQVKVYNTQLSDAEIVSEMNKQYL